MIILGIDPGLATLGYGVIEAARGNYRLIQDGAVITRGNPCRSGSTRYFRAWMS